MIKSSFHLPCGKCSETSTFNRQIDDERKNQEMERKEEGRKEGRKEKFYLWNRLDSRGAARSADQKWILFRNFTAAFWPYLSANQLHDKQKKCVLFPLLRETTSGEEHYSVCRPQSETRHRQFGHGRRLRLERAPCLDQWVEWRMNVTSKQKSVKERWTTSLRSESFIELMMLGVSILYFAAATYISLLCGIWAGSGNVNQAM